MDNVKLLPVVITFLFYQGEFTGTVAGHRRTNEGEYLKMKAITSPIFHAEGPHWDHKNGVLYFVDTFNPTVLRWEEVSGKLTCQKLDGNSIGFIVPIKNKLNKFVVTRDRKISLLTWDGKENNSGTIEDIELVDNDKPNNQFNDGKVDVKGRLWAGTLTRNHDLSVKPKGGSLYLIEKGKKPKIMIDPTSISNGLAWNRDDTRFFFVDSEDRKIYSYCYDLESGHIDNKMVLFDMAEHKDLHGIPDGMTIDCNDDLWVALHGGGSVIQVNSTTGKLLRKVEIPATYVTSVIFGGSTLDTLFVTTSKQKLTPTEIRKEVEAGAVFAIKNLGVKGLPGHEFEL